MTDPAYDPVECPLCKDKWPKDCEQAVCIERFGECICCRFGSGAGTKAEIDSITKEAKRRANQEPTP
jgi:hypothetical protein